MEDLISDLDLFDIQPSKGKYRWSNKRIGVHHTTARLDRFLIHNPLLFHPLSISSKIVSWGILDLRPIALSLVKVENLGPIPFKFNPLWLDSPDFLPLISSNWSTWVDGTLVYIWEQKLKKTKKALKDWAKASFKSTKEEVERHKKNLEELHTVMENSEVHSRHLEQEKNHFQGNSTTKKRNGD